MGNIPDHPLIRNLEQTGYPGGKEPAELKCPVCGGTYYEIYRDRDGYIFGCDECVTRKTVYDMADAI